LHYPPVKSRPGTTRKICVCLPAIGFEVVVDR
jgi:hypothetical protein